MNNEQNNNTPEFYTNFDLVEQQTTPLDIQENTQNTIPNQYQQDVTSTQQYSQQDYQPQQQYQQQPQYQQQAQYQQPQQQYQQGQQGQPVIIINNDNQQNMHQQTQQTQYQPQQQYVVVKSKWVAFWLCLFFGQLGAQYFYCGWTGKGVAMLLISLVTFGFGLFITVPWAIVNLIQILCGTFKVNGGPPI